MSKRKKTQQGPNMPEWVRPTFGRAIKGHATERAMYLALRAERMARLKGVQP